MNIGTLIAWVTTNLGTLVMGVLAILGGFSILAKLTPTEADDKLIQKLVDFIHMVGLTKKA